MSLVNKFSGYIYPSSFQVSSETTEESIPNLADNTRLLKNPLKKSLLTLSITASDEMIEFMCQNYSDLLNVGKINYIKGSYYFSMESFDVISTSNKIYIILDFNQPNARNGFDVSKWIWIVMKNDEYIQFSKNDLLSYLFTLKI